MPWFQKAKLKCIPSLTTNPIKTGLVEFRRQFFWSETSQTGNNWSSSLFYKPCDIFWSVFAPSVVENLANINVKGKKSQKMWKIIGFFVALIFLTASNQNIDISLHKIGKNSCKIWILIEKLEFLDDTLQFSMLNPYAEWKFCRGFCDKKFVY